MLPVPDWGAPPVHGDFTALVPLNDTNTYLESRLPASPSPALVVTLPGGTVRRGTPGGHHADGGTPWAPNGPCEFYYRGKHGVQQLNNNRS